MILLALDADELCAELSLFSLEQACVSKPIANKVENIVVFNMEINTF